MDIKDIQPKSVKAVRRVDWFARIEFILSILAIIAVLVGLTVLYQKQSAMLNNKSGVLGAQTTATSDTETLKTEIDNLNIRIDELNRQIADLKSSPPSTVSTQESVSSNELSTEGASITNKVNINTANAGELDTLPGIGPTYAGRIIDYRNTNGPFTRIEDITNVKGIGDKTFTKLKDYITI